MDINEGILIDSYSTKAERELNALHTRLSDIGKSFESRMEGKTVGRIIGALIFNLVWIAVALVGAYFAKPLIHPYLYLASAVAVFGLLGFMVLDNIINLVYFGNIAKYKLSISHLGDRVLKAKQAIPTNRTAFLQARAKGWKHPLSIAPSIPEKATAITATVSNTESLRSGFIKGVKNVLFFTAVIAITVAGCMALFPTGAMLLREISGENLPAKTVQILNIVGAVIGGITAILLGKLVWGKTNCSANNVTLLIAPVGPIAYLALIALGTLLVMLVVGLVKVLLYILGVVVVGTFVIGSLCGG